MENSYQFLGGGEYVYLDDKFERMIDEPDSFKCNKCSHRMEYKGNEVYICPNCENYYLSEYGRIKEYLKSHPGCSMLELANATGIKLRKIQSLIEAGSIQTF